MIDWQALAAEELERSKNGAQETVTKSGLVVPLWASSGHLRTWFKIRGEPAQILVETPAVAMTRWMAFKGDPKREVCIFHDHSYGQAMFVMREALEQIVAFGVSYPTTEQGRTTPGSIWAGECQCWRYGGSCPKPE